MPSVRLDRETAPHATTLLVALETLDHLADPALPATAMSDAATVRRGDADGRHRR